MTKSFVSFFVRLLRVSSARYTVLQCVAVCCSMLQCVAVCCSVAVSCNDEIICVFLREIATSVVGKVHDVAVCCGVLHCVAVCCSVLQ